MTIPKPQLILDYELFFGDAPPEDRISLIKHISKKNLLYELTALNYRLKPKDQIYIDQTFQTQVNELKYFTMTDEVFRKYTKIASRHTASDKDFPLIFTRQGCIFAIEEIINSDSIPTIENFEMAKIEVWEGILKYILAVNYAITQIKKEKDDENANFETLNPKLLPLNELGIETDQIFTFYRGYWLLDYFEKNETYSKEITSYFQEKYGIEPKHFLFLLLSIYISNDNENADHNFYYRVTEGHDKLFNLLSKRDKNAETHKLLSIRKNPFIKVGNREYLIADNTFLLEKIYNQFLNDFWFDRIKVIKDQNNNSKYNIEHFRGSFGYFFESYLTKILIRSLENYKHSKLLMFDDLKIKKGKNLIEIADIYFRYGNKILLGQVKSGNIYDKEKYGGDVESLYKKDRNKFFENFGVNQLILSLQNMDSEIQSLDTKFPKNHSYEVFPCIIINDKALQTALMAETFNKRFQELLVDFNIKKVKVNPLALISIGDFEKLEDHLFQKPKEIWDLLRYNYKNKGIIPPFYFTLNRNIKNKEYPKKVMDIFNELIAKYNP
jgi:hypothetical protein